MEFKINLQEVFNQIGQKRTDLISINKNDLTRELKNTFGLYIKEAKGVADLLMPSVNDNIVAILSTTILPIDGTYQVETITGDKMPDITGIKHYVGHPDTKQIIEQLGAVPANTKLFEGLAVGESAVCFPIQQGKSSRAEKGFTEVHENVSLEDLDVRIITRIQ